MRNICKKGDSSTPFWIIIGVVLAMIVLIILAFWFSKSIKDTMVELGLMTACQNQGKESGCFPLSEVGQKESEGFKCTEGFLGCKADGAKPYCCINSNLGG